MIKVLLVSPYSEKSVGGIINWTKYIVSYYNSHKGEVELKLLNNENAVQVTEATGFFQRMIKGIKNYIPVCRNFRQITKGTHYDIVHICTSASLGLFRDLYLVNIAKRRGAKAVVHMHFGRIPSILDSKGWERFLLLKLINTANRTIVMDKASLYSLYAIGLKNVAYLPNPLSPDVESIIDEQHSLVREKRKIVYAGHVLETKGVFELVKACREIKNVNLRILGKIPDVHIKERLISEAGENAGCWLSIPGNMAFDDVIKEMLTCSVFVLPSYSEGFPNVILESMACGCAIVSTRVGAIPEMLDIDGDNPCGLCVPPKDVQALKWAIEKMLNDADFSHKCGYYAKERVNSLYTMQKVWGLIVSIWESTSQNDM